MWREYIFLHQIYNIIEKLAGLGFDKVFVRIHYQYIVEHTGDLFADYYKVNLRCRNNKMD